jgi:hypothetical protein
LFFHPPGNAILHDGLYVFLLVCLRHWDICAARPQFDSFDLAKMVFCDCEVLFKYIGNIILPVLKELQ